MSSRSPGRSRRIPQASYLYNLALPLGSRGCTPFRLGEWATCESIEDVTSHVTRVDVWAGQGVCVARRHCPSLAPAHLAFGDGVSLPTIELGERADGRRAYGSGRRGTALTRHPHVACVREVGSRPHGQARSGGPPSAGGPVGPSFASAASRQKGAPKHHVRLAGRFAGPAARS
jgi:hypothetical protein